MSEELANPQTFEQRMKDRIKESIGELISDEELSNLVGEGIKETFFKERTVKEGYHSEIKPPLMVEILQPILREQVNEAVKLWLVENNEKVAEIVENLMSIGMGEMVIKAINLNFQQSLWSFQNNIKQDLINMGNR